MQVGQLARVCWSASGLGVEKQTVSPCTERCKHREHLSLASYRMGFWVLGFYTAARNTQLGSHKCPFRPTLRRARLPVRQPVACDFAVSWSFQLVRVLWKVVLDVVRPLRRPCPTSRSLVR